MDCLVTMSKFGITAFLQCWEPGTDAESVLGHRVIWGRSRDRAVRFDRRSASAIVTEFTIRRIDSTILYKVEPADPVQS